MPRIHFNHPTPLEELIVAASQQDADQQLDLLSPSEYIGIQEPEVISALGSIAIQRAQELLQVAYLCRDELVDQGYADKSRKRAIDLAQAVPELAALEAER